MATFTFKQGPAMPDQTWHCEEGRLAGPSGDSIDFRHVTSGHFIYVPNRISVAQFGLTAGQESISLQCNARAGSESHVAFASLVVTSLTELRQHSPGATFTPPPKENIVRRVAQGIGVLFLAYGVYFATVNGLLADEARGLGLAFGAGMIALAAFWIWAAAPVSVEPKSIDETLAWVGRAYGLSR